MYPIRQFKCFLIIVLCTFTALQSIPSSISSFIGRLKYWSLTDKSKHHNLTRVSWWVSERAAVGECTGGRSSCQPLSVLLPLFVNTICLLLWDVYVKHLQSDRWLIWPSLPVTPTPSLSARPPVSSPSINPPPHPPSNDILQNAAQGLPRCFWWLPLLKLLSALSG